MKDFLLKQLKYHKYGLQALQKVHKIDVSLIPCSLLQAILSAAFPYVELYLTAFMMDALLAGAFSRIPTLIVWMVGLNLILGVWIDALNGALTCKNNYVQREILRQISQKAMQIDYDQMEDTDLLQKISDAVYIMEHIGGYNVFIGYYQKLAQDLLKILFSFGLIVHLTLRVPDFPVDGIVGIFSSAVVSFGVIFFFTWLNIVSSHKISRIAKNKTAQGYYKKMKVERELNYSADEVYLNYPMGKDIRIFSMLPLITKHHRDALDRSIEFFEQFYYRVFRDKETFQTILQDGYTLISYLVVLFKVLAGAITVGELSKYIGAITLMNQSISEWIDLNQKISLQTEFVCSFNTFLDLKSEKHSGRQPLVLKSGDHFVIEFHHVSFRYKNSPKNTLTDICCKITSEDKVALVGLNGAGKTTLIKLLCRLYEPTEGTITLNGVDIRAFRYEDYIRMFSVVFQDFRLFAFPLAENVAAGTVYEETKVIKALQDAGMGQKLSCLEHGIQTNLFRYDTDGVNFSGGEAQKIAIAQALYKDAPIVILDEPTAALDPISEYETFSRFKSMLADKMGIFISHRMGSCKFCGKIFVLDQGRIIQQGSHDQLMQQVDGLYARLYREQAHYYAQQT